MAHLKIKQIKVNWNLDGNDTIKHFIKVVCVGQKRLFNDQVIQHPNGKFASDERSLKFLGLGGHRISRGEKERVDDSKNVNSLGWR